MGMVPGMAPPAPPAPTSAAATASLVLAILGSMCLGPIGGIAAVLVGAVALWDIHASKGRKSGGVLAWIGLLIGGFTTVAYAALILLLVYSGSKTPSTSAPALPAPVYMPPTATTPPTPSPRSGITMSREMETTVTRVGKIVVVDVGLSELSLDAALRKQRTAAQRDGQTLVIQTTSPGCRPCLGVAAALVDPKMQKALDGVRLVRVDVGDFHEELVEFGMPDKYIPGFYLLRPNLSPRDGVHGGEWDDDVADNIAPVLEAFVRGRYGKRRQPFTAPRVPKPRGTVL